MSSRFTCAYNLLGSEISIADASATAAITASMVTTAASSCPSMLAADTAAVFIQKRLVVLKNIPLMQLVIQITYIHCNV